MQTANQSHLLQEKFDQFCDLMATSPRAHLYAREVLAIIALEQGCGVSSQNVRKLAKIVGSEARANGAGVITPMGVKFPRIQELCFGYVSIAHGLLSAHR